MKTGLRSSLNLLVFYESMLRISWALIKHFVLYLLMHNFHSREFLPVLNTHEHKLVHDFCDIQAWKQWNGEKIRLFCCRLIWAHHRPPSPASECRVYIERLREERGFVAVSVDKRGGKKKVPVKTTANKLFLCIPFPHPFTDSTLITEGLSLEFHLH
jgi:hypothetical protein